jgi:hypothetical protein
VAAEQRFPAANAAHVVYRENAFSSSGVAEPAMNGWKVIEENRWIVEDKGVK